MAGLANGTFGTPATFTAPTLSQAEHTPGYQFTQQQGDQGLLEAAAAAGGNISGGTLKSLDAYNTGLANSTYSTIYNQALQSYGANLAGQQQAYQQVLAPAEIGANAANTSSQSIAQILQSMVQSRAAGTVGTANSVTSGINGITNGLSSSLLLGSLLQGTNGQAPNTVTPGSDLSGVPDFIPYGNVPTTSAAPVSTPPATGILPGQTVGNLLGPTGSPISYGIGPG